MLSNKKICHLSSGKFKKNVSKVNYVKKFKKAQYITN